MEIESYNLKLNAETYLWYGHYISSWHGHLLFQLQGAIHTAKKKKKQFMKVNEIIEFC
jgi:hypothetical protein